jgi:SAM-dependent methyltransferase
METTKGKSEPEIDPAQKTLETRNYEDLWRHAWGDLQRWGPQHRHKYRLIRNLLSEIDFASVLDVGCGSGTLLHLIARHFPDARTSGADISLVALDRARALVPGDYHLLDIGKEHLPGKYDLVLCCDVLEHVENDEAAIGTLAAMTGKYLLISVPRGRLRASELAIGHLRNYQTGELVEKLARAGLSPRRIVEWGFPFYSPLYRSLQEITTTKVGEGEWGLLRRLVAASLYWLYWLNLTHFGDVLIVLSEVSVKTQRTADWRGEANSNKTTSACQGDLRERGACS